MQPTPSYHATAQPTKRKKNKWLAVLLSLFVFGLGQIYVGRFKRGLCIYCGSVIIVLLFLRDFPQHLYLLTLLIFMIWNLFDAYLQTEKYNRELMSP